VPIRTAAFWITWVLGTLALAFAWLFGHVPRASGLILGAAEFLALLLLLSTLLLGKPAWQTARKSTGGFDVEAPQRSMKFVTVVACIQVLICLMWIADLVIYELRH